MKKQNKNIYPIIMTHLGPYLFNGFVFKKHKQKIHFLHNPINCDKKLESFLINRNNELIKNDLSKYFLHYHPETIDLTNKFKLMGLNSELANKENFNKYIAKELTKYKKGIKYDPLAVCCAVRIKIEEKVYKKLKLSSEKQEFLNIYETRPKLDFAISKRLKIPEKHYVLSLIYNEACHCAKNIDNFSRLYSKLNNLAIKSLINDI